jgi:hypothetical protein
MAIAQHHRRRVLQCICVYLLGSCTFSCMCSYPTTTQLKGTTMP